MNLLLIMIYKFQKENTEENCEPIEENRLVTDYDLYILEGEY